MVRRIQISKDQLRYFLLVDISRSQSGIWHLHIGLKSVLPHYQLVSVCRSHASIFAAWKLGRLCTKYSFGS